MQFARLGMPAVWACLCLGTPCVTTDLRADVPPTGLRTTEAPRVVTFANSIAALVYRRCSPCHRDGQAAPFDLVTYADVRKRTGNLLEVLEQRGMPPWLPEPGHGSFADERRLTEAELDLFRRWLADGAPEGDPASTPPPPRWPVGWSLGTPDLIATMERPYLLGPEGVDVYRNFVIRVPLPKDRSIRALEFAPGNPRAVHHAFVRVDGERRGRKLDGRDGAPGFPDMLASARMPSGQFLSWNPGGGPIVSPPGLPWRLPANSDLVVEMHLSRSGKPEPIQASVGLYFTDEPATNTCMIFKLASYALNFPAGASEEVVRDSMVLPVDLDLLAVYPHAHFLCREVEGYAVLPDGRKEPLIWIRRWDFDWQSAYRYSKPVRLPRGTTLHLRYTYDNSTNNPANPHRPPRQVVYGQASTDEMCELGFQVVAADTNAVRVLAQAATNHRNDLVVAGLRQRIGIDPNDAEALTRLGMIRWTEENHTEAREYIERAVRARPNLAEARFNRGVILRFDGRPKEARIEIETALRLDRRIPGGFTQLAFTYAELGKAADAERAFEAALAQDPEDAEARDGLAELRRILRSRRPPD